MKKIYVILALMICVLASCSAPDNHFLTDKAYRQQVSDDFQQKVQLVGEGFVQMADDATIAEQEALQFLYAFTHGRIRHTRRFER